MREKTTVFHLSYLFCNSEELTTKQIRRFYFMPKHCEYVQEIEHLKVGLDEIEKIIDSTEVTVLPRRQNISPAATARI